MGMKKLLKLIKKKEAYVKIKSYVSKSKFEESINYIIKQLDQQINKITGQIKMESSD